MSGDGPWAPGSHRDCARSCHKRTLLPDHADDTMVVVMMMLMTMMISDDAATLMAVISMLVTPCVCKS